MPFVRLADRIPTVREGYWLSVSKRGLITISFPADSPLSKVKHVITHVGTDTDEGLLLLMPSHNGEGRVVMTNNSKKGWNVRYTVLPGCATNERVKARLPHQKHPDGILLEMPWRNKQLPTPDYSQHNINPVAISHSVDKAVLMHNIMEQPKPVKKAAPALDPDYDPVKGTTKTKYIDDNGEYNPTEIVIKPLKKPPPPRQAHQPPSVVPKPQHSEAAQFSLRRIPPR